MALDTTTPSTPTPHEVMEEALNLYVDGELPFDQQPVLFAHLAHCRSCRRTLDAVIKFRRMSRQEHLSVPPAVDEAFMNRLAHVRDAAHRIDREADRRPLWQARTRVSLRGVVVASVVVFCLGLLLPTPLSSPATAAVQVEFGDERVEFADPLLDPAVVPASAVYVFYPGLTIEATKADVERVSESM